MWAAAPAVPKHSPHRRYARPRLRLPVSSSHRQKGAIVAYQVRARSVEDNPTAARLRELTEQHERRALVGTKFRVIGQQMRLLMEDSERRLTHTLLG